MIRRFALALSVIILISHALVFADAVVRGYKANGSLQPGSVVALSSNSADTVELAPANDTHRIYGIVVDPSTAPVTVKKTTAQVYVATTGTYPVLISDQNGPIKSGDYLSMSGADGIAAKAKSNQPTMLGQAAGDFDGTKNVLTRQNDGSAVGRIDVNIAIGENPIAKAGDTYVPKVLQQISDTLAGKQVSVLRVYAALTIFGITLLISTLLLISGIRSGMISIGRNPLSRHSIMFGLAQVIMAATAVLIIGLSGVYLLLKL